MLSKRPPVGIDVEGAIVRACRDGAADRDGDVSGIVRLDGGGPYGVPLVGPQRGVAAFGRLLMCFNPQPTRHVKNVHNTGSWHAGHLGFATREWVLAATIRTPVPSQNSSAAEILVV